MFGLRIIRTPKQYAGTGERMKLKQGWNSVHEKYWIQITDRDTNITTRIYMDEEYYKNFHGMGNFVLRQHSE